MKTTTSEVLCDGCKTVIMVLHPSAIFVTLRGPQIGHKKLDFHDITCFTQWATKERDTVK